MEHRFAGEDTGIREGVGRAVRSVAASPAHLGADLELGEALGSIVKHHGGDLRLVMAAVYRLSDGFTPDRLYSVAQRVAQVNAARPRFDIGRLRPAGKGWDLREPYTAFVAYTLCCWNRDALDGQGLFQTCRWITGKTERGMGWESTRSAAMEHDDPMVAAAAVTASLLLESDPTSWSTLFRRLVEERGSEPLGRSSAKFVSDTASRIASDPVSKQLALSAAAATRELYLDS